MIEMGEYRDGAFIRLVRDPRLFSEDDKRYARDAGCEYVCRCSPGRDLRYRFSKDLRLYPVHPNVIASKHAKTCPFSDKYENALANRPAFEVDAETGRTVAFISENIERPVTDNTPLPPRKKAFADSDGVKKQPLGMAELMRTVSMELSVRQAESFNPKDRTIYEMNRWIYMYSKEIELERLSCRLNDSSNENIRFFCERLSGLSFLTKDSYGVSEKELSTFNYNLGSFTNT
ncbi:MAG: hypothetical protein K6E34_10680, partial [Lachnospiraceae bacterium]|nr:hypothetical protein [Lachnospiraceae bacterium]